MSLFSPFRHQTYDNRQIHRQPSRRPPARQARCSSNNEANATRGGSLACLRPMTSSSVLAIDSPLPLSSPLTRPWTLDFRLPAFSLNSRLPTVKTRALKLAHEVSEPGGYTGGWLPIATPPTACCPAQASLRGSEAARGLLGAFLCPSFVCSSSSFDSCSPIFLSLDSPRLLLSLDSLRSKAAHSVLEPHDLLPPAEWRPLKRDTPQEHRKAGGCPLPLYCRLLCPNLSFDDLKQTGGYPPQPNTTDSEPHRMDPNNCGSMFRYPVPVRGSAVGYPPL
ncbi:hypothetical protein GALMADRAFT_138505 [Galerina marginata CBS 339.88]|uniref:Uncharacterized protein n=1 Tax=Galerina marginata (strain CBS 339.88) TaxID=685588 RepID=A0A067T2H8_GALM3|nr:hypothetical protein GALMADRAFT_138505 [Galerina marginata CBS 339.88]